MAVQNKEIVNGKAYNIGGGSFQMSLLELLVYLRDLTGHEINVIYDNWRPGDQKVYVSDISKAKTDFGWEPKINVESGVRKLFKWINENKTLFKEVGIIQ